MTLYTINRKLIYDDQSHVLNSKDGKQGIKLTHMRAKLMDFILKNRKARTLSRKQIADELWGQRSEFIPDANLTQLLYLIRRDLKTFGIDNFFITIPRHGIQINDDVIITVAAADVHTTQREIRRRVQRTGLTLLCLLILLFLYIH
ncbi:winged helix-turn-helix domain-containing protein [Atlantibacter sp.]|uniref:winged helix-turn-helix domain-containing protein n=1 Tax=Atlantibacter sp. TaxID=1903473 RepID=UPI0028B2468D|nr:winged helix-turn-helix domain-containing protein [Atlantibacter sp.]